MRSVRIGQVPGVQGSAILLMREGGWPLPSRLLPFRLLPFRLLPFRLLPFRLLPFRLLPFRLLPFRLLPSRLRRLPRILVVVQGRP